MKKTMMKLTTIVKKQYILVCFTWDINSLKFLDKYNLKFQKVASAMIVDETLLKKCSKKNTHLYQLECLRKT